jgi:hypothetical protein
MREKLFHENVYLNNIHCIDNFKAVEYILS